MRAPVIEIIRGLGLGGAESLLAQRMSYCQSADIRPLPVLVNTYSSQTYFEATLRASGIKIQDLETSGRWTSMWRLFRAARRFPKDSIVVVHSPWPALTLKLMKLVGQLPNRLVEVAHSETYAWPMMAAGARLNHVLDLCIAVSEDVAAAPTTAGTKSKRVVLAGADSRKMRAWVTARSGDYGAMRSSIGVAHGERLVASVANLYPYKGLDTAIRVVASMGADVHLVVAGEGPARGTLEALVSELDASDRIHLLGSVPDAWRWMAVADAVIHPSRREGLPVALIEARVLGTPVVASRAGGIPAVLASDGRSLVVDDDDTGTWRSALMKVLEEAPDIAAAFPARADKESEWDISRYAEQFDCAVQGWSVSCE